jgi:enoyl-CoA hydratase/carnithine racemase
MPDEGPIMTQRHGAVLRVVLNRPDKLNALDATALSELRRIVDEVATDPTVRVVLLTGSGRAFCAGVDLGMTSHVLADRSAVGSVVDRMHRLIGAIERSPVPWVAVINGMACAGGLELTLGCDIAIASSSARLADIHARHGLFPGGGASQRLPRLIGPRRARWMLLTGEWVDAKTARDWGPVTEVVAPGELDTRAAQIAALLAKLSPRLVGATKTTLLRGEAGDVATALQDERELFLDYMGSADARIGLDAFAAQAEPVFPPRAV